MRGTFNEDTNTIRVELSRENVEDLYAALCFMRKQHSRRVFTLSKQEGNGSCNVVVECDPLYSSFDPEIRRASENYSR